MHKKPKPGTTKICVECLKEFYPNGGAQIVCSPECGKQRDNRQQREGRAGLKVKTIPCRLCGNIFLKDSPMQKTCRDCLGKMQTGVGSGNYRLESNYVPYSRNGKLSYTQKLLESLGDNLFCAHCSKDLREIVRTKEGFGHWSVHHIDHNRKNNSLSNLQLLCASCHGRYHRILQMKNRSASGITES